MVNSSKSQDSTVSKSKVNGTDRKIPSDILAKFADQNSSSENTCVSYTYDPFTKKSSVNNHVMKKWRSAALILTTVVTVVSLLFSVLFIVLSSEMDSSSVLTIGLDAFFAIFGTGLIVWRFWSPQEEKVQIHRERAGSMFFAVTFILSGITTFGIALYRLLESTHPEKPFTIVIALGVFTFLSAILTLALYKVARKLKSQILMALTMDTFFASILALGVLLCELLYLETAPKFWYLDESITIGISLLFILCGVCLILKLSKSKDSY